MKRGSRLSTHNIFATIMPVNVVFTAKVHHPQASRTLRVLESILFLEAVELPDPARLEKFANRPITVFTCKQT